MNVLYAAKIERPKGVPEDEPLAVPVTNPLVLHLTVKYPSGGVYKGLATAKRWITFKSDLSLADDASGVLQLVSGGATDPFTVVSATRGKLDIVVPGGSMDSLTVDTIYYVDVQILDGAEPCTILYDRIKPYQPVTKTLA